MPSTLIALAAGSVGSAAVGASSASSAAKAQTEAANQANETERYIFDRSVDLTEPQRLAGNNALAAMQYEVGLGAQPTVGGIAPQITTNTIQVNPGASAGPAVAGTNIPNRNPEPGAEPSFRNEYSVGGQTFQTLEEAQAWANANKTGGTPYGGFKESPGYQFALEQGNQALQRRQSAMGVSLGGASTKEALRYKMGMADQEWGNYYNRLAGIAGVGQTATQQQLGAGQNYATAFGQNSLAAGQARASGYAGVNNAIQGGIGNGFQILGMHQAGYFS